MDLKQLEHFIRVVELGSFTRAAMVLGLAQPALSRQIRALEVELRQTLLHRHGRGVEVTESGEVLLRHARAALHHIDLAREELGQGRTRLAGKVSVGLPPLLARVLTIPLTHDFREQLPDASLAISEGSTIALQDLVMSGRLDIALMYSTGAAPELETTTVSDEELLLVGRTGDAHLQGEPMLLEELARLPLVIPARPSAIRTLVESQMLAAGLKPRIALEVEGTGAILNLVRDGVGYAVLPRSTVEASGQAGEFATRALQDARLVVRLVLVTSAARAATPTQAAAGKLLREAAQRVVAEIARAA